MSRKIYFLQVITYFKNIFFISNKLLIGQTRTKNKTLQILKNV